LVSSALIIPLRKLKEASNSLPVFLVFAAVLFDNYSLVLGVDFFCRFYYFENFRGVSGIEGSLLIFSIAPIISLSHILISSLERINLFALETFSFHSARIGK
jgi:hypothetical protein